MKITKEDWMLLIVYILVGQILVLATIGAVVVFN